MNQRMKKLAGLRKIAEGGAYGEYDDLYKDKTVEELYEIISGELDSMVYVDEDVTKAVGYYLGKSNGTEEGALEYSRRANPSKIGGSKTLKDAMDNKSKWMYDTFKQEFAKGRTESYKKIPEEMAKDKKTIRDSIQEKFNKLIDDIFANLYKYKDRQTKDQALAYVKRMIYEYFPQGSLTANESSLFNDKEEKKTLFDDMVSGNYQSLVEVIDNIYGGSSSGRATSGGSSRPQATTGEIRINEEHSGLTDLVDGNDPRFVYTTAPDGSWADYTFEGKPGSRRLDKTFKNWPEVVTQMNKFPIGNAKKTPAAGATAAPAATGGAAEAQKAEKPVDSGQVASFDPQMISNVSIILQKASTRAYAMTVPGNQKKQIKDMLAAIGVAATSAGISGVTNPSQFLANLIIAKRGPASFTTIGKMQDVAALSRGDIKSAAKEEVRLLMEGVNEVYRIYGADDYQRMVRQFASVMRRGQAASAAQKEQTAQIPAAEGEATASYLDLKIKKLAKLRRLRVRSQMEAAIEPSAKFGRSRIS
jgi:hypothetical protein